MVITPLSLREDYWENFTLQESDFNFIYNLLIDKETPMTPQELVKVLINERIRSEKKALESQHLSGDPFYLPKECYKVADELVFPAMDWRKAQVVNVRAGNNPGIPSFDVMEVVFENGEKKQFAINMLDHALNQPVTINLDDPKLNDKSVYKQYGAHLVALLTEDISTNDDLVCIAGRWFPRALLVDVNMGYLNLAEALLEMEEGRPLSTQSILEQIELPTDTNAKLTEFSLNLALQEDGRFDEVGPSGETLWVLKRLEPDFVQKIPPLLRYTPVEYAIEPITDLLKDIQTDIRDELEPDGEYDSELTEASVCLIYPHLISGTLPLSTYISSLFPTAYESSRVLFTFKDGDSGEHFQGWVVRGEKYIYGLNDWYQSQGLIPGSLVTISRSQNSGEVIIRAQKRRQNREWIRTALVGSDGGIVFTMMKQSISANYDERMAIVVSNPEILTKNWDQIIRQRVPLEKTVKMMLRELARMNAQGHVHAEELYAAVNLVRRCPPGPILSLITERSWAKHQGDLYFRLEDAGLEDDA